MDPTLVDLRETSSPLIVWKNSGETLDQLLDRVRLEYNLTPVLSWKGEGVAPVRLTYAGRLDPLASGIMIILAGDAVHDKDKYNKLDKRYRTTVVLGFETDTYDVIGVVQNLTPTLSKGEGATPENLELGSPFPLERGLGGEVLLKQIIKAQIGTHIQTYPPYSSKNINGVPLWKLARDGNLPEVLPSREVVVYDAQLTLQEPSPRSGEGDTRSVSGEDLLKKITNIVSRVTGDFRQAEILDSWKHSIVSRETYTIIEIDYHVGSGTYIRGLVHELGQQLGTGAVLIGLERYQVGEYTEQPLTEQKQSLSSRS
jgi:tRNA pseudouridine55 synthase